MSPKIREDFYVKQQDKLLSQFDKILYDSREILLKRINGHIIECIFDKMREEYRQLIPEIPYIGGRKNSFTSILLDCINLLAIFRVLEAEGFAYNEIGEYCYEYCEKFHKRKREKAEKAGQKPSDRYFQDAYIEYLRNFAKNLQKKTYPEDWVFEFVEGDRKTFDYGFNFTECGVVKFFRKLGNEKYIPLICLTDFVEAQINGFGFRRIQTLGNRAPICDHRFIENATTPRAWPPYSLEEWKLDKEGNFK